MKISGDRVELLLRALEVSLLRRQGALLVRLLRRLVFHILGVRSAVHGRLAREPRQLFLLSFCSHCIHYQK